LKSHLGLLTCLPQQHAYACLPCVAVTHWNGLIGFQRAKLHNSTHANKMVTTWQHSSFINQLYKLIYIPYIGFQVCSNLSWCEPDRWISQPPGRDAFLKLAFAIMRYDAKCMHTPLSSVTINAAAFVLCAAADTT
jgi:hypothetical protein